MNTHRSMVVLSLLALTACNKSSEPQTKSREAQAASVASAAAKPVETSPTAKPAETSPPLACDGPEMKQFTQQLQTASGFGVEHDGAREKAIGDAIASIKGKRFTFTNCAFKSQGNDVVKFAPRADAEYKDEVECKMAGGESGNRAFRDAAMKLDMARLKLDVTGVVGTDGGQLESYVLTECTITPHE